jgi:hypothetical protein
MDVLQATLRARRVLGWGEGHDGKPALLLTLALGLGQGLALALLLVEG